MQAGCPYRLLVRTLTQQQFSFQTMQFGIPPVILICSARIERLGKQLLRPALVVLAQLNLDHQT